MHASIGSTPFDVNGLMHSRIPLALPSGVSGLCAAEVANRLADASAASVKRQVSNLLATRLNVLRHVRDAMADSQDRQKEKAYVKGRGCIESY